MPMLLDIYKRHGITTTCYFTGYMAEHFPEVVRMAAAGGHEVASHGYSHEVDQAFDVLPYNSQVQHLDRSRKLLEDLCGRPVISFRAPALRVNSDTPGALIETGFRTDSSVASQRFDMFLSFGGMKKMRRLFAPRLPYRTRTDSLYHKGDSPLVEVPLTAMILPYVGTTMRMFPAVTRLQRRIAAAENRFNRKPVVFDIHPNEFLEEGEGKRIIARRSKNFFTFIMADLIRGNLKVKNLGKKAIPLYENEISFYKNRGFVSVTVQDYCKSNGWI
ncbi:MAG: polysaccharide deacetylase family protein [Bacteroidia bacterium]|nr:polysaccharide deacetylase family protein [Bacteroidia bacterium]